MNSSPCFPRALGIPLMLFSFLVISCSGVQQADTTRPANEAPAVQPVLVSDPVSEDSDDPAFWIHPTDPSRSMVLGTDKGGYLWAFDLQGNILADKTVSGLQRANNVDVEYGLPLGGELVDIAVVSDRDAGMVHIYRLPELTPIDGGGYVAFADDEPALRRPMGVALYKRPGDGAMFAIVSRKEGPSGGYLWQYRLQDDGTGQVQITRVRQFGQFSGSGEIEAVAVDDELGYVYYSDETAGIRKYLADPDAPDANQELALFGTSGFAEDREGISIYKAGEGTGYILVSDQQANSFRVFPREGHAGDPHDHPEIASFRVAAADSDGSDVVNLALGDAFPNGLFVAMSDDKTFHFYSWKDLAEAIAHSRTVETDGTDTDTSMQ